MHSMYGYGKLGKYWEDANHASRERRLSALQFWAQRREDLLGAVFFTVSEADMRTAEWRPVIEQSQPYCDCPDRRVLWPTVGRTRMRLRNPTRTIRIDYQKDPFGHGYYCKQPLIIAPHGGDLASAYGLWAFRANKPYAVQQPFMAEVNDDRLIHNGGMIGYDDSLPHEWLPEDMDEIKQQLLGAGELPFWQIVPLPNDVESWLPTCSIIRLVSGRASDLAPVMSMIFEIDASVQVITYSDVRPHRCKGGR